MIRCLLYLQKPLILFGSMIIQGYKYEVIAISSSSPKDFLKALDIYNTDEESCLHLYLYFVCNPSLEKEMNLSKIKLEYKEAFYKSLYSVSIMPVLCMHMIILSDILCMNIICSVGCMFC